MARTARGQRTISALVLLAIMVVAIGAAAGAVVRAPVGWRTTPMIRSRRHGPPPVNHPVAVMPAGTPGIASSAAATPSGQAAPLAGLAGSANLTYQGGYVMHTTQTFAIFWHPPGTTPLESNYKSLVDRYLTDIGGSATYDVLSQYTDTSNGPILNASSLAGVLDDTTTPYPRPGTATSPLTDGDVQGEVDNAIATQGGIWAGAQPLSALTDVFLVFLPKGVYVTANGQTSFTNFCAYHSAFYDGTDANHIRVYGAMPYAGTATYGQSSTYCTIPPFDASPTPNNDLDADSEINLVSHELFESVTDPFPAGAGYAGWFNGDIQHEIGDQCNFVFGPLAPDDSDIHAGTHPYLVQTMWSNGDSTGSQGCVATYPDHFVLNAPADAHPGRPFSFTVMAADHNNHTAFGYSGTVHFTSSDGSAVLPPDTVMTGGTETFSATLDGPATISATDTGLATLAGTSAAINVDPLVQQAAAGVYRAGTVLVTLPNTPSVGDTLVLANMIGAGNPLAPSGWQPVGTFEVGGGDVSSVLAIYEHKVVSGDGPQWSVGSTDTSHNITAAIYEVPSSSGTVDTVASRAFEIVSPTLDSVSAPAGDFVLGVFAANPVHDQLAAVSGTAGMSGVLVADSQGLTTGTPFALGAFGATVASGQTGGQVTVASASRQSNDGELVTIAFRP